MLWHTCLYCVLCSTQGRVSTSLRSKASQGSLKSPGSDSCPLTSLLLTPHSPAAPTLISFLEPIGNIPTSDLGLAVSVPKILGSLCRMEPAQSCSQLPSSLRYYLRGDGNHRDWIFFEGPSRNVGQFLL